MKPLLMEETKTVLNEAFIEKTLDNAERIVRYVGKITNNEMEAFASIQIAFFAMGQATYGSDEKFCEAIEFVIKEYREGIEK